MKRLSIKSGVFEFNLESDDLQADFKLLKEALSLTQGVTAAPRNDEKVNNSQSGVPDKKTGSVFDQGMNTFVARLKADTARKIMQAAAYSLSLKDNKEKFTKSELYARAREAKDWKADYTNQQSVNLGRMVSSGELTERSGGVYSVPDRLLDQARQTIANG